MNECVKKKLDLNSAIIRNAEALGGKNVSRDAVKKVSFQSLFKVAKVSELTTLSGGEFQTVGAATEKARLAKTVGVRGTASLVAWLDRSGREGTCGTSSD